MGEPAYQLPEEGDADIRPNLPDLRALEGGNQGDGVPRGSLASVGDAASNGGFYKPGGDSTAYSAKEALLSRVKSVAEGLVANRKVVAGGSVCGGIIGLILLVSAVISSGPFESIHFAQILSKFHLSKNENFSDDRTSKILIYALQGKTARGRLGDTANKVADIFEKRIVNKTGLSPVYTKLTGQFIGYEIVDDNMAFRALEGATGKNRATLERIAGKGADFSKVNELKDRQAVVGINGKSLDGNVRILDLKNVSTGDRRTMTRVVGRLTNTNKTASFVSSRLLAKRGDVDFHPLKNVLRKSKEKIGDYVQRRINERNERIRTGEIVSPGGVSADSTGTNPDGTPRIDPVDQQAVNDTNQFISKIKGATAEGLDAIKASVEVAKGPAIVVGVLCAVKGVSSSVDEYKYANQMQLLRFGASFITLGSQAMAGKGLNLDELGAVHANMYDPARGLGWESAKSIQAEEGMAQTGPDISPDAKPSLPGDNPFILKAVDAIPVLGTVCGAITAIGQLPIVKQVSAASSAITDKAINTLLKPTGYTISSLVKGAIGLIAGRAIDLNSKGPDLGSLANYGVRVMANDQAISKGGRELTNAEVASLNSDALPEPPRSVAERYLNPYLATSLAGKLVDKVPYSMSSFGASVSRLPAILSTLPATFFGAFNTKALAANTPYDYGFPLYGYSKDEQSDARFEDPYKNEAALMSLLDGVRASEDSCAQAQRSKNLKPYPTCEFGYSSLYELNTGDSDFTPGDGDTNSDAGSDYAANGRQCFSSEVDSNGVLTTGKSINTAKVSSACKNTTKEVFLRYRIYIADTITAKSLACYEANDESACKEIGFNAGSTSDSSSSSPASPGGAGAIVGDVGLSSDSVPCAVHTTDLGVVDSLYNGALNKQSGQLKIRICQLSSLPGLGDTIQGIEIPGGAVVNSRVSGAWQSLGEKAKADHVSLVASSSFRLTSSCGGLGDGKLCAAANSSMHQLGVAIDFSGPTAKDRNATTCTQRQRNPGEPMWDWLNKNALAFGFRQYTAEAWHWDNLNDGTRCGGDGS